MKAAITAGTLMNRRNWSNESIAVTPPWRRGASPEALFRRCRDVLLGGQKLVRNGGPAHREQRQNRDHGHEFHGRYV